MPKCDLYSNKTCVMEIVDLETAMAEGEHLAIEGKAVHIEIYSTGIGAPMVGKRFDLKTRAWAATSLPVE